MQGSHLGQASVSTTSSSVWTQLVDLTMAKTVSVAPEVWEVGRVVHPGLCLSDEMTVGNCSRKLETE